MKVVLKYVACSFIVCCANIVAALRAESAAASGTGEIDAETRKEDMRKVLEAQVQDIPVTDWGDFIRLDFGHVDRINHLLLKTAEASCNSIGWDSTTTAETIMSFDGRNGNKMWTKIFETRHAEWFRRWSRDLLWHGMQVWQDEGGREKLLYQAEIIGTEKFPLMRWPRPASGLWLDIMVRMLKTMEAEWNVRSFAASPDDDDPLPPPPPPPQPGFWDTFCGSSGPRGDAPCDINPPLFPFPAEEEGQLSAELGGGMAHGMICP